MVGGFSLFSVARFQCTFELWEWLQFLVFGYIWCCLGYWRATAFGSTRKVFDDFVGCKFRDSWVLVGVWEVQEGGFCYFHFCRLIAGVDSRCKALRILISCICGLERGK